MTDALVSEGATLGRGDAGSPEAFTAIEEIIDFDGPGGAAAVIDATHLGSTFKEKLMGLPDEGQFTITCNYTGGTQQEGLRTDRANRTLRNFKFTDTDSPANVGSFAGYVLDWSLSGAVDDKMTLSVTIEISGQVTWA